MPSGTNEGKHNENIKPLLRHLFLIHSTMSKELNYQIVHASYSDRVASWIKNRILDPIICFLSWSNENTKSDSDIRTTVLQNHQYVQLKFLDFQFHKGVINVGSGTVFARQRWMDDRNLVLIGFDVECLPPGWGRFTRFFFEVRFRDPGNFIDIYGENLYTTYFF